MKDQHLTHHTPIARAMSLTILVSNFGTKASNFGWGGGVDYIDLYTQLVLVLSTGVGGRVKSSSAGFWTENVPNNIACRVIS